MTTGKDGFFRVSGSVCRYDRPHQLREDRRFELQSTWFTNNEKDRDKSLACRTEAVAMRHDSFRSTRSIGELTVASRVVICPTGRDTQSL